jgi:trk system potassium uptake protein
MLVLIAGGGSVGRHMASRLASSGHEVRIIDKSATVVETRSPEAPVGVRWIFGDACDVGVLSAAGAREADVFASVTGDDEDNLVISLLAKQEFGVPRVIARVNNPRNEWLFTDMWGIDFAVSTPQLLSALVEEAVSVGALVQLLSLQRGRANLSEVTLTNESPAVGKRISETALPREAAVVAIIRAGHVLVPAPDMILLEGDETIVLLTGSTEDEDGVRTALVGKAN